MKSKWFYKNLDSTFKGSCRWNVRKVNKLHTSLLHEHTWCKKFNEKYCEITGPEAARKWIKTQVEVVGTGSCASLGISPDLIDPNVIKLKILGQKKKKKIWN